AASAVIVLGLIAASWLTSPAETPATSTPAATPAETKKTESPVPGSVPTAVANPATVEIPPPAPAAEVPSYEPPRVDLTKPLMRPRVEDAPRGARGVKGPVKKAGATPSTGPAQAATPHNDS